MIEIAHLLKLAENLVSAAGTAKANAQLIDFQKAVIQFGAALASAQQQNATLAAEKRDMEEQLVRLRDWEAQKPRYQLRSPSTGSLVYALKRSESHGEPPHYICAACYDNGERSILQDLPVTKRDDHAWVCSKCKAQAMTGLCGPRPTQYAEEIAP